MIPDSHPLAARFDPEAESPLRALLGGALRTQALYVAAKLGIADQLALGPRTAEELSRRPPGADAGALRRVLRALVASGVFVEREDGRFGLNPTAEFLQTAHPRSLRSSAVRAGEEMWSAAARLFDTVATGCAESAAEAGAFFNRLDAEGRDLAFDSRMGGSATAVGEALAALDCIARARTIVDVGGGHGALLAALLQAHPHLRGVLLDRSPTVARAETFLDAQGCRARCELVAGDFFASIPAAGDVYLLSWVLHDWDDERAGRILRGCRAASRAGATLLIVEIVLPPQTTRTPEAGLLVDPYTLDLHMLLLTGGRERTEPEYAALLTAAGYDVRGTRPLSSARGVSVIEAEARAAPGTYE